MSLVDRHFLDFEGIQPKKIYDFFSKVNSLNLNELVPNNNKVIAHLFFEPSTRTQLSFNVATIKNGAHPINFTPEVSSMKKGETFLDTILTIQSMGVNALIIRHGYSESLKKDVAPFVSVPVVNAGEGISGHPSQALLDVYTIFKHYGKVEGVKVLFIGDVIHSRVAKSNFDLLALLGAKIGICCPEHTVSIIEGVEFDFFDKIEDGLKWADVCMALRIQKERHTGKWDVDFKNYQLNLSNIQNLKKEGIIMHPGPFNRGIELTDEILDDPRCMIWNQVNNGVRIRTVLMKEVLNL